MAYRKEARRTRADITAQLAMRTGEGLDPQNLYTFEMNGTWLRRLDAALDAYAECCGLDSQVEIWKRAVGLYAEEQAKSRGVSSHRA